MRNVNEQGRKRLTHAALMAACVAAPTVAHAAISISTVTIGNAGNAADTRVMNDGTTGYGSVGSAYSIGKYEVTAAQYTAFLNAVAATDTYGLYNTKMASDTAGCQIIRSGTSGGYTYSVAGDYANRPVNYVSWGDSARFSNWLSNNQPTGTQSAGTTESGAYTLSGATTAAALNAVTRSGSAAWFITSENEWYKAAFYDPTTGSYNQYATGGNVLPSNTLVDPDPGNNANYRSTNGVDTLAGPYYRTEVGEFENSDSPYGTFDQNGNVWEWNESTYLGQFKEMRGGAIGTYDVTLSSAFRYFDSPTYEANTVGFRVGSSLVSTLVTLTTSDAEGTSSFNSGLHWTNSAAPSSGNTYSVAGGLTLRTVADGGSATFAGGSLTIGDNGASAAVLRLKNATGSTVTINNLTLNNGTVINGGDGAGAATSVTVAGSGFVLATGGGTLDSGAAGRTLAVSSAITGGGALTTGGAGTVSLTGSNTYTGATTVTGGTLKVGTAAAAPLLTGVGAVNLNAGQIVFDYGTGATNAAAVRAALTSGHAGNFATGQFRSTAATSRIGLGYADDAAGRVTVKIALYGDADLDGGVSINDFNALAGNFGVSGGRVWTQGDFDYDGGVSINDFNLLAANFGQTLASSGSSVDRSALLAFAAAHDDLVAFEAVTGVPEPTAVALLGLATITLRRRRGALRHWC